VQSGFDAAFVKATGDSFWIHAEHIFSDLHLFFGTGAIAQRAWRPWAPLGIGVSVEPYGLRVTRVGNGNDVAATWIRAGVRSEASAEV